MIHLLIFINHQVIHLNNVGVILIIHYGYHILLMHLIVEELYIDYLCKNQTMSTIKPDVSLNLINDIVLIFILSG